GSCSWSPERRLSARASVARRRRVPSELSGTAEARLSRYADSATMTTEALLTVAARPERRRHATVEIVVPVYNEAADLEASVRRLHRYLTERFPLSWLITIADNASVDNTWGIACRLALGLDGVQAVHLDEKGR